MTGLIVGAVIALLVIVLIVRAVRIVPQAHASNVERLGRYLRTLEAGLHVVIPFVDKVRPRIDMREQVVSFDPPPTIKEAMEKQMRAERDKRAAILTAEGARQSAILTAEGEKQSSILRAEGDRESRMLTAQGQAGAIETVFAAVHAGDPDPSVLAYQYLQTLPQLARDGNTFFVIPSELTSAMQTITKAFDRSPGPDAGGSPGRVPPPPVDAGKDPGPAL